jgi:glycosyltransferase involved in cell wall biosynthesis
MTQGPAPPRPSATIVISTFNRAPLLARTLESLAGLPAGVPAPWDVLIVDNNSTDDTPAVVARAGATFPVPLRRIFEPRPGKSIALNTALAETTADVIVFTDDDVRVPAHWIDAAVTPLLAAGGPDYTGGPARPWWEASPPAWLDLSGRLSAPLAIVDYGSERCIFEERGAIPLGVNMAVRRSLIERAGGFNPELGRTGNSLLGQEQAEFFHRSRAAGGSGWYVPEMWVEHFVPASRVTFRYFARWWYWKGVSQRRWHGMHGATETGVDLSRTRRLLGVPLYILRALGRDALGLLRSLLRGARYEMISYACGLAYAAGYARETWWGPYRKRAGRDDSQPAHRSG